MVRCIARSLSLVAGCLFAIASSSEAAQFFGGEQVWFRADAGVLNPGNAAANNGDAVATWEDQIGSLDVVQSNNSFRPTYVTGAMNGLPALDFDIAGTDFLNNTTNLPPALARC